MPFKNGSLKFSFQTIWNQDVFLLYLLLVPPMTAVRSFPPTVPL